MSTRLTSDPRFCHGIPSDKELSDGDILNIDVAVLKDGWTVITKDLSLSAQWEHMVLVTRDSFEVLTAWPDQPVEYKRI
jgi:methionine aminopeptidase